MRKEKDGMRKASSPNSHDTLQSIEYMRSFFFKENMVIFDINRMF